MAQLESLEHPTSEIVHKRKRIQQVQCRHRWTASCLNWDCWAFHSIGGRYYCIKDGLPVNPARYEYRDLKEGKRR